MSSFNACGEPGFGIIAQTVGSVLPGSVLTSGVNGTSWSPVFTEFDHQKLLKRIEARLAIIEPNQALQDKYPALQEAYEAYKIIERLVNDKKA